MIKFREIGSLELAKPDGTLEHSAAVKNYSVLTKGGVSYLIANEINGDKSYIVDVELPAGEKLCGYDLMRHLGEQLVITADMITNDYDTMAAGDTVTLKSAYLVGTAVVKFVAVEKIGWGLGNKAVVVKIDEA